MATIDTNIKKGQYLKKTKADSYVHYHFDTDDSIVYLSEKIDGEDENGVAYAKDARLHDTLCALYTLASEGGQAATDLATLTQKVDAHIANKSNPHGVTPKQIGLGSVVNVPMDNTPTENSDNYVKSGGVYTAVKKASDKADQAISIANGQSRAYVFANIDGLKSGTLSNNQPIQSGYKIGDSIYIIAPDVSDFWISGSASTGTASTDNDIQTAKKGATIIVKWGSAYVSLTAFESKRDLNDYVTTSALNSTLKNIYDIPTVDEKFVPYSGAKYSVNLGDHTLKVSDGKQINETATVISKGGITLVDTGRLVDITANGIIVQRSVMFNYPDDATSGTLATQEFVRSQIDTQANSLINQTRLTFSGDVSGTGVINDPDIQLYLNDQRDLPDDDKYRTFSAVHVNKQGIVTSGAQQIVFAHTINDSDLNNLAVGGVAIIDA